MKVFVAGASGAIGRPLIERLILRRIYGQEEVLQLLVTFALTAFAVLMWRVLDGPNPVRDVTAGVFTAAYVPFLAGFAVLLLAQPDGASRVLARTSADRPPRRITTVTTTPPTVETTP